MDDKIITTLWENENKRVNTQELLVYNSLEEKRNLFSGFDTYNSGTVFLNFITQELPEITKGKNVIYRGMGQAKHRLFNKAQRAYEANKNITAKDEEIYHESIAQMIENARTVNNAVLASFFKAAGLKDNDVAVLSFLQHYGAPTPFMDWTTDPFVSLYFAIAGSSDAELKRYEDGPDNYGIDNYFSFYLLIEDHILEKVSSFSRLSVTSKTAVTYQTLKKKPLQYIDERFKSGKPVFSLINNLHITNQKGLFIYNNSAHLPLEEVFLQHWLIHYIGNTANGRSTSRTPLICINFHKSIGYRLRNLLQKMGINDETIYSKPEAIVKKAIPDIFKNLR